MSDPSPGLGRCSFWQLRSRRLEFGDLPALMGIVNVTPDSFSDGGDFFTPSSAIDQALRLEDEGADIIDVGGESTRPYSTAVDAQEELRRIEPVVSALSSRLTIPISIDTSKSIVARAGIELGAQIINDVTGLQGDPDMLTVAAETKAGVCVMHMQGSPQTMQDAPQYEDVVEEVFDYLKHRVESLQERGISRDRICLDPGIGFGKSHEHNLQLLASCERFGELDRPVLIGHSRKAFVGKLIASRSATREAGNVGIALALACKRIQVIRLHDVRATRDALICFRACGGL